MAVGRSIKNAVGRMINRNRFQLAALTGLLLVLAFPKANLFFLAWPALILFWQLQVSSPNLKYSIYLSLIAGGVFFFLSLFWLNHIAFVGWVAVSLFELSFWILLGYLCFEFKKIPNILIRSFLFATTWCVIEWLRSEIPVVGLGWNLLSYSQSQFLSLVQFSDIVGSYGVSFIMAWITALFAEALMFEKEKKYKKIFLLLFALLIFMGILWYGMMALEKKEAMMKQHEHEGVRITVIQGNIPQSIKWETIARDEIFDIYIKLSQLAHYDMPQMIVWPEAAFPNYFNRDANSDLILDWAKELEVSFLIGAPYYESQEIGYNSAFFINHKGNVEGRYDKTRLVPFGEYVPFAPFLNALKPLARSLGISDFSAGKTYPVFDLTPVDRFGVLICFEDTFSDLSRKFANQGATFLTVITNDAWFKLSGASQQHLQASIFRALETGLPIVRAANTGISGFINIKGELESVVEREGKRMEVSGYATHKILKSSNKTLFLRGGWLFPYVMALILALAAFTTLFIKRVEEE